MGLGIKFLNGSKSVLGPEPKDKLRGLCVENVLMPVKEICVVCFKGEAEYGTNSCAGCRQQKLKEEK